MNKGSFGLLLSAAFLAASLAGCQEEVKSKTLFSCKEQTRSATVYEQENVRGSGATFVGVYMNKFKPRDAISHQSITTVYSRATTENTPVQIDSMKEQAKAYCADGTVPPSLN